MGIKISELNAVVTTEDTDVVAVVNNEETKKTTKANLLKEINEKVDINAPFTPTYDFTQETDITVADDTYESVAVLLTENRVAGTYKLAQSMIYSLNTNVRSAFFRFSTNGGVTWSEIRREPKDNLDKVPLSYTTTVIHGGGIFDIQIEAKKENATDIMEVYIMDITLERKI